MLHGWKEDSMLVKRIAAYTHSIFNRLRLRLLDLSAPLIRSRLWRYINLFTYLLTYLLT